MLHGLLSAPRDPRGHALLTCSFSPQPSWAQSSAPAWTAEGRSPLPVYPGGPAGPSAAPALPWWIKNASTSATSTSSGSTLPSESLEGVVTLAIPYLSLLRHWSPGTLASCFWGELLVRILKVTLLTTWRYLRGWGQCPPHPIPENTRQGGSLKQRGGSSETQWLKHSG